MLEMGALLAILYILHKSFHTLTLTGFIATVAIALSANYYMITYMNVNFFIALAITPVIFPILQLLFKKAFGSAPSKRRARKPVVDKLNVRDPKEIPDQDKLDEAFPEFLRDKGITPFGEGMLPSMPEDGTP